MQSLAVGCVWNLIPAFLFVIVLVPTHSPTQCVLGLVLVSQGSQSIHLDQLVPRLTVHKAFLQCLLYTFVVQFKSILPAYLFTLLLVWDKIHFLW